MKLIIIIFCLFLNLHFCFADDNKDLFNQECLVYNEIIKQYPETIDTAISDFEEDKDGLIVDGEVIMKPPCFFIAKFSVNNQDYIASRSGTTFACGSGGCQMIIYNLTNGKIIFWDYVDGDVVLSSNKILFIDMKKELVIED